MPELLPEQKQSVLLSLSRMKKIAFLVLLFERMRPELRSYFLATGRDLSVIQRAQDTFWRLLCGDEAFVSWSELTEEILDLLPDSEDDGSEAASFSPGMLDSLPPKSRDWLTTDGTATLPMRLRTMHRTRYTPRLRPTCKYMFTATQ